MKTDDKPMNAFHPAYAKTYHADIFESLRTESRQTKAGQTLSTFVEKKREKHPSHGTIPGISKKVIPSYMHRPKQMLRPVEVTAELIEKLKQKGKK